jgi:hypothetical protein
VSEYNPPWPLSYRAELLKLVMPALRAGECCSLVGVSGVGKSNLVRFLRQPGVQETHWGSERAWMIVIDTNELVFDEHPDEYVIVELMIHRLIMEAESRGLPLELLAWANELHARLVAQPSAHLALRYLERMCARFCGPYSQQLIFIFDQFEDIWQSANTRFFLNLRSLRDRFKYQVGYLVFTREPLQRIRADLQAVEAFWELFTSHTYGLGMYSPADAQVALERLTQRYSVTFNPACQQAISRASGGHPGLMRALFTALDSSADATPTTGELLKIRAVEEECAKIWNDLNADDQRLVQAIAAGAPVPQTVDAALVELRLKQIIVGEQPRLFSPIFGAYALCHAESDQPGIVVDSHLRRIWRDGQLIEKALSPLEFALLEHLARHTGKVCRREDILRDLYQQKELHGISDERLDNIVSRLREALHENARKPRYLITHRGVGFQLLHGSLQE